MSEAVRSFAESTERIDLLAPVVAQVLGRAVNATCIVRLLSDDRRFLNPSAMWCREPGLEASFRRTFAAGPIRIEAGTTAEGVLRGSQTMNIHRGSAADFGVALKSEIEDGSNVDFGPLMMVALRTRHAAVGLVYLLRGASDQAFEGEDASFAEDLCDQASVALGNALRIQALQVENDAIRRQSRTADGGDVARIRRVDAMAALASGLAHDYDNLVSVIRMCTNLQEETLSDDPGGIAELARLREATERAAELTPMLSRLSRRRLLRPELVDLSEIVEGLGQGLRQMVDSATVLDVDVGERGSRVCVDPARFVEVLTDLIINARKAVDAGGTIHLNVGRRIVTDDDFFGVRPGMYAVVSVADQGMGMNASTASRVTRPFFSQWATEPSQGLGLASVLAFAQQCEGTLTVTSRPGLGSTVSLLLPTVSEDLMTDPRPPQLDGVETILVALTDVGARGDLRGVLRRHGYQVLEAHTARHAIDVSVAFGEPIHAVILDANAGELKAEISENRPDAVFIEFALEPMQGHSPLDPGALRPGLQPPGMLERVRRALTDRQ